MQKAKDDSAAAMARADKVVLDLAKIAFSNMGDFVQFGEKGEILHIDHEKAREVGAKVSVVTRKVGRGKNAREVRQITISMPDKLQALEKLGKHLGLFPAGRKCK